SNSITEGKGVARSSMAGVCWISDPCGRLNGTRPDGRPLPSLDEAVNAAWRHVRERRTGRASARHLDRKPRRRHQRLRHRAVALGLAQQAVKILLGRVRGVDGEAQAQGREAGADLAVEAERAAQV